MEVKFTCARADLQSDDILNSLRGFHETRNLSNSSTIEPMRIVPEKRHTVFEMNMCLCRELPFAKSKR